MSGVVLIGAGGHARGVAETLAALSLTLSGYADPRPSTWCAAPRVAEDALDPALDLVVGLAGVEPEGLGRRLALIDRLLGRGHRLPPVIDPRALVAADVVIEPGVQVLAGAILRPGARIGRGAIVNTGALVEHDAVIGPGAHVAPRAVVLGGARIGATAMIGANAVVLPAAEVPEAGLVKAQGRFPR